MIVTFFALESESPVTTGITAGVSLTVMVVLMIFLVIQELSSTEPQNGEVDQRLSYFSKSLNILVLPLVIIFLVIFLLRVFP